jgi:hypothetical protein
MLVDERIDFEVKMTTSTRMFPSTPMAVIEFTAQSSILLQNVIPAFFQHL